MHVIRPSEVTPQSGDGFVGRVSRQPLITGDMSKDYTLGLVNFEKGARNDFHIHPHDQVLIVTYGNGIVATDEGEVLVHTGDIILIPAGERHWHGATPDSVFSHINLGRPVSTQT